MSRPTFTVYNAVTHGTPYQTEALRLAASLAKFSIPWCLETYEKAESWVENCAAKAGLIRRARERISGPLVWLDADAELVSYPYAFDLLSGEDCDIAINQRPGEGCISCTIWFPDTDEALNLIDDWEAACRADPGTWDQKHLNPLRDRYRFADLDREYAALHKLDPWTKNTVIRQHQASRRFKQEMNR